MTRLFSIFILLGLACHVTEQHRLQPSSVIVEVSNPSEFVAAGARRLALVWTLEEGLFVGIDLPWESVAISGTLAEFPLLVPPDFIFSGAVPAENFEIIRNTTVRAYRPRLVLYEDLDRNGRFLPTIMGGVDQIVGIDTGAHVPGAIPDLETVLEGLSLEATESFYAATGGRFSPFVPLEVRRGGLFLATNPQPTSIVITNSEVPSTILRCQRTAVRVFRSPLFATSRVSAFVDTTLDLGSICGGIFPECDAVSLTAEAGPSLETFNTEGEQRVLQCRRSSRLQTLIVQTAELQCEPCTCSMAAHADVYFVDPAALPPWWPCGSDIDYCDSDLPMYLIDAACGVDEEAEDDGS